MLAGFLIAMAIAHRVKRLAQAAGEMAAGSFDAPLDVYGPDEIGDLARALDSMRASLKESFGVLTADRNKLTAIFDGLTDAVMVVDDAGAGPLLQQRRRRAARAAGPPPEAMLPQLRRAAEVGFAAHPALRIGDRAYAMQARSLPDEGAVLAVVRDRTDEMRREFAEADFVSNAAHELRNPLAGISGAIEVLQERRQGRPRGARPLPRPPRRGRRADEPPDPVAAHPGPGRVDRRRGDRGGRRPGRRPRRRRRGRGARRGSSCSVEVEPDLAAKGDPTLLRQVMIGLLTNAFKNTPAPGAVTVRGRRDGETEIVLEVIDTGTGIPAEEIERVFERFYRRTETRKQEGFGLGLAIARRMVDVMGGEIGATSERGEGSTFWVRLPVAQPSPTPVA